MSKLMNIAWRCPLGRTKLIMKTEIAALRLSMLVDASHTRKTQSLKMAMKIAAALA